MGCDSLKHLDPREGIVGRKALAEAVLLQHARQHRDVHLLIVDNQDTSVAEIQIVHAGSLGVDISE